MIEELIEPSDEDIVMTDDDLSFDGEFDVASAIIEKLNSDSYNTIDNDDSDDIAVVKARSSADFDATRSILMNCVGRNY